MSRSLTALKATPPVKQSNVPDTILRPHDFDVPSSAAAAGGGGGGAAAGGGFAAAFLFFSAERTLRPDIVMPDCFPPSVFPLKRANFGPGVQKELNVSFNYFVQI